MIAISYGWTWPAFAARRKGVTRRDWKPSYAKMFIAGREFIALDKDRRAGGKPIGVGRVTRTAYLEPMSMMPDSDYEAEGFAFMHEHPELLPANAEAREWAKDNCSRESFNAWRRNDHRVTVVRFEILEVTAEAIARLNLDKSE